MVNMKTINYENVLQDLRGIGFCPIPEKVQICIPNAKDVLWQGIRHFTGGNARWLPEYDEVAAWMSTNQGRGLLCLGSCGRGKSLICAKILPVLLNFYNRRIMPVFDAQEMNRIPDEVIKNKLMVIDDLGTENVSVKYGERRMVFPELCDAAEKQGKMIVVTTNLSLSELRDKYGERTIDRLRAVAKPVLFSGESLRK